MYTTLSTLPLEFFSAGYSCFSSSLDSSILRASERGNASRPEIQLLLKLNRLPLMYTLALLPLYRALVSGPIKYMLDFLRSYIFYPSVKKMVESTRFKLPATCGYHLTSYTKVLGLPLDKELY